MWCSDVDLHSHSTHSDGTLDVATLAASMAREGVACGASPTTTPHRDGKTPPSRRTSTGWPSFLAWNSRVSRRFALR